MLIMEIDQNKFVGQHVSDVHTQMVSELLNDLSSINGPYILTVTPKALDILYSANSIFQKLKNRPDVEMRNNTITDDYSIHVYDNNGNFLKKYEFRNVSLT